MITLRHISQADAARRVAGGSCAHQNAEAMSIVESAENGA